jgi:translation initiation factor 1
MAKGKQRIAVDGSEGGLRQSLPGLAALRERLPAARASGGDANAPGDATPAGEASSRPGGATDAVAARDANAAPDAPKSFFARSPKLVVRREKKGHGGKIATRIEGLIGSPHELEKAAREIKRALGCGATVDRGDVVVQGDLGERVRAFLAAHGARKIVIGS